VLSSSSLTPHPPRSTLFPYTTLFRSLHIRSTQSNRLICRGGLTMAGPRRGGRRRKKVCYFTANGITHIDYKEVELLKKFISERRSEEHTSELQSRFDLVCRLLLEKKK